MHTRVTLYTFTHSNKCIACHIKFARLAGTNPDMLLSRQEFLDLFNNHINNNQGGVEGDDLNNNARLRGIAKPCWDIFSESSTRKTNHYISQSG